MLFSKSMNVITNNLSFPMKTSAKMKVQGGEREGSFLDGCSVLALSIW